MRPTALATTLLLTLSLAACGGDAEAPATSAGDIVDAATAAANEAADVPAESPPLPTGDFRIASVTLGKTVDAEGQVREPVETFASTDKIHAAVVGVGSSGGLTLSARWIAADGTEVASAGQSLSPSTPTVTTFSIAQPQPWPPGGYRVEIAINGRVAETRSFLIQ